MKEADFKKDVLALLQASGLWFMRMPVGRVQKSKHWVYMLPEGTPDFMILIPHHAPAWLELKGKGQVTERKRAEVQEAFRARCMSEGHWHLRSDDITEVAEWLSSLK